jgi:hypothetical protein
MALFAKYSFAPKTRPMLKRSWIHGRNWLLS